MTAAALAVWPAVAAADTVSIEPDEICNVFDSGGGQNCDSVYFAVGNYTDPPTLNQYALGLLKFDVAGNLPSGATVTSAKLVLNVEGNGWAPYEEPYTWQASIGVHQMTHDWTDDVTWDDYDGVNAWPNGLQPGTSVTDYAAPDENVVIDPDLANSADTAFGSWEWDVTRTVRAWATSSAPNYGVAVVDPEPTNRQITNFWGESVFSPSEIPRLEIEYTLPCPSDPFAAAQGASADAVYAWNEVLLDVYREVGGAPTPLSRAGAMMNVAIFDTFNSVFFAKLEDEATGTPTDELCGWASYRTLAETPPTTDADDAAGIAARAVLLGLYSDPDVVDIVEEGFDELVSATPDADAEELGAYVAAQTLADRDEDGSDDAMPYTPVNTPGAWRSTDAACVAPATPGWGLVTPFALYSGSQFRESLPAGHLTYANLLASSTYATQFQEVKDYGAATGSSRNSDQTELAWFWANDLDRTYKPPGQLLAHTRLVAESQPAADASGTPTEFFTQWSQQGIRVARLFASVSLAMADAGIAAWDEKYLTPIDLWRPITGIHEADTDGNGSTSEDDLWQPLSANRSGVNFSPCFPAWVSGHATFGAAWAQTMEAEFRAPAHDDPFPLTLTTEDPHSEIGGLGSNTGVFVTRDFDSFHEAAQENADSRIFLGVHWRMDAVNGMRTGRRVADYVTDSELRWSQTCASWSCATAIP
ncbi:DNRLRE domain-containing protein [Solirubrobacter phytolaccae]|uniref:DNRLRE domain-containing protein n=1 Tax=Solirubrobacter phytolaccae TaxID=1404360 RepID=A0A9X3S7U0_9ACTN|nr:DNRLRE domain-containing protein [Solirubrobacter phytolaccae]MDA0179571.1 DNRLRE domain-containing protein [Solirubrobacter phytolaccae]